MTILKMMILSTKVDKINGRIIIIPILEVSNGEIVNFNLRLTEVIMHT
jgi:hypothetical protein